MRQEIARYEKNLREELDGSALYAALAEAEVAVGLWHPTSIATHRSNHAGNLRTSQR